MSDSTISVSASSQRDASAMTYLCVLIGDLQEKGQVGVVEGVVERQEGPMDPAF